MTIPISRHINDLRTLLSVTLKQKNEAGTLTAIDLTSHTVKFKMINQDGTVIIAETDTGITYDDRPNGKVSYDFTAAAASIVSGMTCYAYFTAYNASSKSDHFPVVEKELKITFYGD